MSTAATVHAFLLSTRLVAIWSVAQTNFWAAKTKKNNNNYNFNAADDDDDDDEQCPAWHRYMRNAAQQRLPRCGAVVD